jgi:Ca2+-transporting ATPase
MIFVNGAPEFLLEMTTLSMVEKENILSEVDAYTRQGKRLMGMVRKEVHNSNNRLSAKDVKVDFEWVGVLVFSDPVRVGVKKALDKAKAAGIKLLVITGDYTQTAVSVMRELGLYVRDDLILTGDDLKKMSNSSLARFLAENSKVKLFARTTPDQKLKIVESLKGNGEVVAMMGDGVNDAPALNRVDIGIVVGEATDVAKESADLVLLDSKFETVIAAIEEGRGIFDNIRKVIMYLMSTAFNEITAVVGAIVMGLPLPVTAAQILWINIISDGFPDLALTVEPKRKGIMKEMVRSPKQSLVSPWMKILIGIVSITSGLLALFLFAYVFNKTGDRVLAQSVGFVALGINSLVYVFSIRTLKEPFWKEGFFDNKWLIGAVVAGFVLQVTPFLFERSRYFFGITSIPLNLWLAIFATTTFMFFVIEILKVVFRLLPERFE